MTAGDVVTTGEVVVIPDINTKMFQRDMLDYFHYNYYVARSGTLSAYIGLILANMVRRIVLDSQ